MINNPSFDLVTRKLNLNYQQYTLYYISSLVNSLVLNDLIASIVDHSAKGNIEDYFNNGSVSSSQDQQLIQQSLLSGCCIVEDANNTWIVETRSYPTRSISEPETEKSIRGSKDGFTESVITNVGLIRRRLRCNDLVMKMMQVGDLSQSDICISYIESRVDHNILDQIVSKIETIQTRDLIMTDRALEEIVFDQKYNPFPKVRYTERPDIVSAHLVSGSIAIIVDTSASVMLCPTTLIDALEHVEEYRQTPIIGTFIRIIRYLAIFMSIYLMPLWLMVIKNEAFQPTFLESPQDIPFTQIVIQILIVELCIEILRIATIHTPTQLASATGLIAAILLGQFAVELGLFIPEILIYSSIGNIGHFATPNYEISLANKLVKILYIIVILFFYDIGFIVLNFAFIYFLIKMKSCGRPYLFPIVPFDPNQFLSIFIRKPKQQTS